MQTYLIEVPHDNNKAACNLAINIFKTTGSHWLTNADFGCLDDVHKAWINISANSKKEALNVVPPAFREKAKAIKISKFALEKVEKTLTPHHK